MNDFYKNLSPWIITIFLFIQCVLIFTNYSINFSLQQKVDDLQSTTIQANRDTNFNLEQKIELNAKRIDTNARINDSDTARLDRRIDLHILYEREKYNE